VNAVLYLSGIRGLGHHGASPGEQDEAQEFVADVQVVVSVGGDRLEDTADYRALVDAARDALEGERVELLENLALAVGRAVFAFPNVERVIATVHKPRAAGSMGIDDVFAEAIVAP
jgi:dihydroneopterin aldolase